MKIIRNGQGYELIEITREDQRKIRQRLRQANLRLMKQCLRDAERAVAAFFSGKANEMSVVLVAAQLFDKLATKQYSEEQRVLTKKVHWMKEEYRALKQATQGHPCPAPSEPTSGIEEAPQAGVARE